MTILPVGIGREWVAAAQSLARVVAFVQLAPAGDRQLVYRPMSRRWEDAAEAVGRMRVE